MRLQLTAVCVLGAILETIAHADPEGDRATVVVRESGYFDNDATTISTTVVSLRAKPIGHLVVDAQYIADAVSSASVDIVTAATGRWTELRSEVATGAGFADGTTTAHATYTYSHENDWASHGIALGGSRDFYKHNLTLGGGAGYIDNHVGRADDDLFSERQHVATASLSVVWVGNPKNIFSLAADGGRITGYQASPYRYAFVADPGSMGTVAFPEAAPDTRLRSSLTLRWNHAVGKDSALRSHLRGYADDWGVRSLTTGSEFVVGLEPFEVAADVRLYAQRGASFYQDVYAEPKQFMIADRELSSFQDVFAGLRGGWIGEHVAIDLQVTGFAFRFPEFSRLPRRTGVVTSLGLVVAL